MVKKAVVFDYDGVIVDSAKIGFGAYQEIADTLRLSRLSSLDEFREKHALPYLDIYREWGITEPEHIELASGIFWKYMDENVLAVELIPSIKETIEELSQSYRLAVVSGNRREIIEKVFTKYGLIGCFEFIIGEEDVTHIKPHPEGLELCCKKMELAKDEILFLGDTVSDISMGRAVGVQTAIALGYSWNTEKTIRSNNPDYLIKNPVDVLQLLKELS